MLCNQAVQGGLCGPHCSRQYLAFKCLQMKPDIAHSYYHKAVHVRHVHGLPSYAYVLCTVDSMRSPVVGV